MREEQFTSKSVWVSRPPHQQTHPTITKMKRKTRGRKETIYFFSIGPTKYPTTAPRIRAAIAYICQLLAEL